MLKPVSLKPVQYRQALYQKIRRYFSAENVLEVETPILSLGTAVDAHIDVMHTFETLGNDPLRYLQTSPELYMKRLLCQGYPSIYQIGKVFRKGEKGKLHRPEFTMLEWYRLDYSYEQLMDEVSQVVHLALPNIPVIKKSYRDVFIEYASLDPFKTSSKELLDYIREQEMQRGNGENSSPYLELNGEQRKGDHDLNDLLIYILTMYIEPNLPQNCLFFIYNYPVAQANLAQVDPKDPSVANRFEAYYNGVELCNGFEELLDGSVYRIRFEEENGKRKALGKDELVLDEAFLTNVEASNFGLPPCSGVALGLDRLIMLAMGKTSLDEVLPFA